ncbi:MAG: hypothetical protein QXG39_03000 [Candidatus Aenigmatarchaeota archaeon]
MSIRKGQTFTYDFFIASSIFLIVLILVMSNWYFSIIQTQETIQRNHALNTLFSASEVWFKDGYPRFWDVENVVELGLSNDGTINKTKMELLNSLGYSEVLSLLNSDFNLCYEIWKNGSLVFRFPQHVDLDSAKNVYKLERIGILDEQPVKVVTLVWK